LIGDTSGGYVAEGSKNIFRPFLLKVTLKKTFIIIFRFAAVTRDNRTS